MPDHNTIWQFAHRIGADGAAAIFQGVDSQLRRHGYIARGGQAINVTLVSALIQHFTKKDKAQLDEGKVSEGWSQAK